MKIAFVIIGLVGFMTLAVIAATPRVVDDTMKGYCYGKGEDYTLECIAGIPMRNASTGIEMEGCVFSCVRPKDPLVRIINTPI